MYRLVCSKMFKIENLYGAQYFPIIFSQKDQTNFLFDQSRPKKAKNKVARLLQKWYTYSGNA